MSRWEPHSRAGAGDHRALVVLFETLVDICVLLVAYASLRYQGQVVGLGIVGTLS